MPLFKPKSGDRFRRDEVVSLCLAYVHSAEFSGNVTKKEQKISLIQRKPSGWLEFRSRGSGEGWGDSAMNPNCWIPTSGEQSADSPNGIEGFQTTESVYSSATDSGAVSNKRPWQSLYRNGVLRIWKSCVVTGCRTASLLTASHIKPVIHCTDIEKVDPYNGLLLSKTYDGLFDRGLISFEDDGRVLVSDSVPNDDLDALGIDRMVKIALDPRQLPYLRFHREKVFKSRDTFLFQKPKGKPKGDATR